MKHYIDEAIERLQSGRNKYSCIALEFAISGEREVDEWHPLVDEYQRYTCRNGEPSWWNSLYPNWPKGQQAALEMRIKALLAFKETL